jgi:hypothetical protein
MSEARATLTGTFLCTADIALDADAPLNMGQSPWRNRRVSNIAGGHFNGERFSGTVLQSGADWSEAGTDIDGNMTVLLDIRSVWKTDDEAMIYVTYNGRLVVPAALISTFTNPELVEAIDPADYYFRINPVFEVSDPHYHWLNNIVCIGLGQRTKVGVRYQIFMVD